MPLPDDELGHEPRVDERLAGGDLLDRAQERLVGRLLEDVAARARLEAALEERPLAVRGEDQDRGPGDALEEHLGRLEAVHVRHAQVHDHDVGPPSLGQRDGRRAVGRLADDADPRRAGEREAETLAHDLVVVGDQAGDLIGHAGDSTRRLGRAPASDGERELLGSARCRRRRVRRGRRRIGVLVGSVRARALDRSATRPAGTREPRRAARSARPRSGQSRGERLEEVLACPGTEVDDVRPDAPRACRPRLADDRLELLRAGRRGRGGSAPCRPRRRCPPRRGAGPPRGGCGAARSRARSSARRARRGWGSRSRR